MYDDESEALEPQYSQTYYKEIYDMMFRASRMSNGLERVRQAYREGRRYAVVVIPRSELEKFKERLEYVTYGNKRRLTVRNSVQNNRDVFIEVLLR